MMQNTYCVGYIMTMRIQSNAPAARPEYSGRIEECRAEVQAALVQCRRSRHWHKSDLRYLRDARAAMKAAMRECRGRQRRPLRVCDFFQFTHKG